MLILTEQQLVGLLEMKSVIEAVQAGFVAIARDRAIVPERVALSIQDKGAVMFNMPAALYGPDDADSRSSTDDDRDALGTKVVSVFPQNREREIDVVQSIYMLLHSRTGAPLALMDGRYITGIRTAATSAVATRLMARRGPVRLAIFGSGVQARFHLQAMIEAADVESVLVCSRDHNRAAMFADKMGSTYGIACEPADAEKAASEACLICTCTTSNIPLFDGSLLSPGSHINAVGAYSPATRELDTETVRRSRVIIDADSAAGREAGDILIPLSDGAIKAEHIKGTLADVVTGKVAGRTTADEITLFKSCGLAIEDLVTAGLAYALALKQGIGTQIEL